MTTRFCSGLPGIARLPGSFALIALAVSATSASATVTIKPGVDLRYVMSENSDDGRGPRAWAEGAIFVDALVDTNRVKLNGFYRLGYRQALFGQIRDRFRHNANINMRTELLEDFFFLDVGAQASQYTADQRGFQSINNDIVNGNQTQVYSGFAEPSIVQRLGEFADVQARYRFGAVKARGPNTGVGGQPSQIGLGPNDGIGALLTDSVTHSGGIEIANRRETNTVTWSIKGDANHDNIDQLNQRYRRYNGVFEAGLRVSRTVQFVGKIGYENIDNTQDSILFDSTTGRPILDANGNTQIDPAMPRRTAFRSKGVIWDVGVRLTPSRRTALEFRGGRRFGDTIFSAHLRHQTRSGSVFTGYWSEDVSSVSRLLTQSRNGRLFNVRRVGGFDQFGVPRCIIGIDPVTNDCVLGLTQSLTAATFKLQRGAINFRRETNDIIWFTEVFYDRRRYVDSQQLQLPNQPRLPAAAFLGADTSFGARGRVDFKLNGPHRLGFDMLVSRNKYALTTNRKDTSVLLGATYSRTLSGKLSATASLFAQRRFRTNANSSAITGSVGLRYQF